MNNGFTIMGSDEARKQFLESSINACDQMIQHYTYVIDDISSDISNPVLNAKKGPSVIFLKEMRKEWQKFRNDLHISLKQLERK